MWALLKVGVKLERGRGEVSQPEWDRVQMGCRFPCCGSQWVESSEYHGHVLFPSTALISFRWKEMSHWRDIGLGKSETLLMNLFISDFNNLTNTGVNCFSHILCLLLYSCYDCYTLKHLHIYLFPFVSYVSLIVRPHNLFARFQLKCVVSYSVFKSTMEAQQKEMWKRRFNFTTFENSKDFLCQIMMQGAGLCGT